MNRSNLRVARPFSLRGTWPFAGRGRPRRRGVVGERRRFCGEPAADRGNEPCHRPGNVRSEQLRADVRGHGEEWTSM